VHETDHVAGNPAAPITLVEFGDYECPFCGRASVVVTALHPHALVAAEAAEAAEAQGRFWRMHDILYAHQKALELPALISYATQLQLDVDAFARDLQTHRFRDKLRADVRSGALSGVNGTPTFFINGWRHDGDWDFDSLFNAIAGVAGAAWSV
jgi:protein-disulfide isomerase